MLIFMSNLKTDSNKFFKNNKLFKETISTELVIKKDIFKLFLWHKKVSFQYSK
jgi:hypothetical protein